MTITYYYLIVVLFLSVFLTVITIKFIDPFLRIYTSNPHGPQKIHKGIVPRLGGLSILCSLLIISLINLYYENNNLFLYFLISLPVFILGFLEDITQSIKPILRLGGTIISACFFILVYNVFVENIDIQIFDFLLKHKLGAITFTILCIVFLTQAFNIIDGLNGLSVTTGIICFWSIAQIAMDLNDYEIYSISITFLSVLLGVLILNFSGKIFIGDSGAYIIGLFIAITAIKLMENNDNISPFAIAYILIYPSYELSRTILYRIIKKKKLFRPDKNHLHSLLNEINTVKFNLSTFRANVFSSIQIIFLQIVNFILFINYYNESLTLLLGIGFFIIQYEILYNVCNQSIIKLTK